MPSASKQAARGRHLQPRRIIVVVVPPVDELDLVGPDSSRWRLAPASGAST
jgi:hypothetical protein